MSGDLSAASESATRSAGRTPPVSNSLPHILIVDDKSRDGWKWGAALRRTGCRVSISEDTWAGWHALDVKGYDLIITSQDAKGRTGLDLIRKLRISAATLPYVLIVEKIAADSAEVVRSLQPGAALEKPVPIPKLLAVVRQLLRADDESRAITATA